MQLNKLNKRWVLLLHYRQQCTGACKNCPVQLYILCASHIENIYVGVIEAGVIPVKTQLQPH